MSHARDKGGRSNRAAWIIVTALIGTPVLLCAGAMLLPHMGNPRDLTRRSLCKDNLHNITIALHNYHETYGTFPPAYIADKNGRPMHSWRVLILPQLEAKHLYDKYRFDEPWDGPNNRRLASEMPNFFHCPSAPDGAPMTHYLVVVGPKTVFPGAESIRFRQVRDGTTKTLLVVEAPKKAVHWMKPDDISPEEFLRQMASAKGDGGQAHSAAGT